MKQFHERFLFHFVAKIYFYHVVKERQQLCVAIESKSFDLSPFYLIALLKIPKNGSKQG